MSFVSKEQVLKILIGFNPWWRSGIVPKESTKPVKRFAYYEAKQIFRHPSIRRTVLLSGARRVGKTTIMYQIIESLLEQNISPNHIVYVSFDHPVLKFCEIGEILEVFQHNIAAGETKLFLFFDEVQYAKDWDTWIKTLYDQNPYFRIMATGSASPVFAAKSSESGVGRWTSIRVPTLSFYEYIELINVNRPELEKGIKPTELGKWPIQKFSNLMRTLYPLQEHFHRYLLVGGFPEIALSDDVPFAQRILREDVVDKVLKRDMTALFGIRNVAELEKIFLYLCIHSGSIIVQDTIAKEIRVSRPTVANYMELLAQANLIYVSNPVETGGKKALKARPKVYVADAAIRNAVLMLDNEVLTDPNEMGIIIETSVYKHVAAFYYSKLPKIGYYRDNRSDKEVDVIVSLPVGRILLEVKYREDTSLSEREAIVELSKEEKTVGAILVTKRAEDFGVLNFNTKVPIVKIPAYAFMYLLGHAEKEGYTLAKTSSANKAPFA